MSISDQGLPELASICSVPTARDLKIGQEARRPKVPPRCCRTRAHSQAPSVTRTTREAAVIDDNPEPLPEDVPQLTHLSPKAVELFQRALEIEAAGATGKWEPEGRRLEYIDIDIALMRELGQGFWGVSVLDVHENAEGPPAWERNPRNIESWHEAIRLRRALVDAVS